MTKLFERVSLDPEANACYITVSNKQVVDTIQDQQDCWVDMAQDGSVVGIEILNASQNYALINSILLSYKPVEECLSS